MGWFSREGSERRSSRSSVREARERMRNERTRERRERRSSSSSERSERSGFRGSRGSSIASSTGFGREALGSSRSRISRDNDRSSISSRVGHGGGAFHKESNFDDSLRGERIGDYVNKKLEEREKEFRNKWNSYDRDEKDDNILRGFKFNKNTNKNTSTNENVTTNDPYSKWKILIENLKNLDTNNVSAEIIYAEILEHLKNSNEVNNHILKLTLKNIEDVEELYKLLDELYVQNFKYLIYIGKVKTNSALGIYLEIPKEYYYNDKFLEILKKYSVKEKIFFSKGIYTYNPNYNKNYISNNINYEEKLKIPIKTYSNQKYFNITKHPKILWTLFGYNFNFNKPSYSLRQLEGKNYDKSWLPDSENKGEIVYKFTADRMGKINEFQMLNKMPVSEISKEGRYETIMMYFVEVAGTNVTVYKRKYKRLYM